MLAYHLKGKRVLLASGSPRRRELLKGLDIEFDTCKPDVDESFPEHLKKEEVAIFLSRVKAEALNNYADDYEIIITADTIVCMGDEILNKPADRDEALEMLTKLSGKPHEVITGVSIRTPQKTTSFSSTTTVWFRSLQLEEMEYYVDKYQPFDKAGSYGIQEWIGFVGIEQIEGCYFNVMGLPLSKLYGRLNSIN